MALYVDDALIAGRHPADIKSIRESLSSAYKLKDLGEVKYFLAIAISYDWEERAVEMSQRTFIGSILAEHHMSDANGASTPMESGV